jgi:hypothetical protein
MPVGEIGANVGARTIEDDALYGVDASHPIPNTELIDVTVSLENGGASYGLVIAQPLAADERSQKRLLRKFERYLNDFHSASAKQRFGMPRPDRMKIHVSIHPESDPLIFELLEKCRNWVEDNSVSLVVHLESGDEGEIDGPKIRH